MLCNIYRLISVLYALYSYTAKPSSQYTAIRLIQQLAKLMITVKQSAFLMEYAKTENLSQACRVAGINRSTGYKYLENEDFQAALEQTKNKIVNAAWTKLSSQLEKAVDKVVAVLDDPKASVNARLRATELIFNYASRYADSRDILSRMERLEDSLNAE